MTALRELLDLLKQDEVIEAIVFGDWGWRGYNEPEPPFVPEDMRGVLLSLDQAAPLMKGWSFYGRFGSPKCYAVWVWTNQRTIWVSQYDGSTGFDTMPRNPVAHKPYMPGA